MAAVDGLRYSYDGSGWVMGTNVTLSTCYKVAYGLDANMNPIWVATGTGTPTMQYSPDGIQWQNASGASFSVTGSYVTYSGGIWLAGGSDASCNNILWSSDGMYWNTISTNPFLSGTTVDGIAYDGSGLWIACGNPSPESVSNNIWFSNNATDWYPSTSGEVEIHCISIAHGMDSSGHPLWVVATNTNGLKWSSDGSGWNSTTGTSITLSCVFYSGDKWFAAGGNILTSSDGKDWVPTNWQPDSFVGLSMAYGYDSAGSPLYIVVGGNDANNNNVLYSSNGIDWNTTQGAQPIIDIYGIGIAYTEDPPTTTTTTTTTPPPCFVAGTQILCPSGYKAVEDLQSGDHVLTADRRSVPVKLYSFTIKATADTAPFRIAAHALGPGFPKRDLHVSPRHAIKDIKGRWQIPKYLAYHNKQIQQYGVGESVTYYHVECPNFYKDNLIAEGTEVESYKNRQGTSGVVYMWSDALRGWERVHNKGLPKQLTTHVIYSI